MTDSSAPSGPADVELRLDGSPLPLATLDEVLDRPLRVALSDAAWARLTESRATIERHIASGEVIYGVNTGFGKLCNKRISAEQLGQLQENLVLSHAVGVGPALPAAIIRLMMVFKINALLLGASGLQPDCVRCLVEMLNADMLPVIPSRGSLGASGDLAPLAHLVLPMIGRGEVVYDGRRQPAAEAMASADIRPMRLAAKDGLALINGTQLMQAYAAAISVRGHRLARHADLIATMSLEAYRGSLRPFREDLLALRPHRGAREVGENVRRMMVDSEIMASHADCEKVQDPYSLRCIPQVHGACRDALRHLTKTMLIESGAVTDNPVLIGDEVLSGGNFHGEPLALPLDYVTLALTEWANISERRQYLLLSGPDDLPTLLMKDTGLNSGFMIPQYTAAALVNECKVLSTPASVDSIPTSLGQEDHVSMGAESALKSWQVLDNAETVLAIEMLCAAQALDYRLPVRPGIGPRVALETFRETVPHVEADRLFGEDIQAALHLLRSQTVLHRVEEAIGALL